MNIFLIILIGLGIVFLGGLFLLFSIVSWKENYFLKYLSIGDVCRYYISEEEDVLCEVIEIDGDKIKLKNLSDGTIYNTIKNNISTP